MTAVALPTLLIGDAQREEFRDAAQHLAGQGAVLAADIKAALAVIKTGFAPALIVVAQSSPGGFSERQIDQLRRAAPLARIIRLLGTWMDGDGRTGRPSPAIMRANWQRWDRAHSVNLPNLAQPVTAGEDDRLLANYDATHSQSESRSGLNLAIYAPARESAESLDDLFSQRGWSTLWIRSLNSALPGIVDGAIFDARGNSAQELEALAAFKAALGETPIVVLLGFPRIEDLERFQAAGASAVVAKPYLVDDLVWQIEQLLPADVVR